MFAFLIGVAASVVVAIVVIAANGGEDPTTAQLFGLVAGTQALGSLGAALLFVRKHGSGSVAADLGLRFRRSDLLGLLIGVGLQILVVLIMLPITELLGIDESPQDAIQRASEANDAVTIMAAIIAIGILAPISEEVIFRGMMFRSLRWRFTRMRAVWISAAIFGGIHLFGVVDFNAAALILPIPLTGVGVVLAMMTESRRSITMPIMTHMGFNPGGGSRPRARRHRVEVSSIALLNTRPRWY